MLYYRYRSGSEMSLKELIYDEMFFSSTEECNDPYEGKLFAEFPKDEECWANLIRVVTGHISNESTEFLRQRIVSFFLDRAPISVDEVLKLDENAFLAIAQSIPERILLSLILFRLKEYIMCYIPSEKYFVCFSKSPENYLMWSHYANNHKGYCLVFRTMDGKINQCPLRIKKSVSFLTPKSFSPRMTFPIEPGFRVEDMVYRESQERLNAFMGFPVAVNANKYTPEEVKRYQNESSGVYTKKHTVWEYEKEARIVLSSGISWLAGERLALSPHQRLLHYDSTQLIGLVFGAKIPPDGEFLSPPGFGDRLPGNVPARTAAAQGCSVPLCI